jgi:hypothetical protein
LYLHLLSEPRQLAFISSPVMRWLSLRIILHVSTFTLLSPFPVPHFIFLPCCDGTLTILPVISSSILSYYSAVPLSCTSFHFSPMLWWYPYYPFFLHFIILLWSLLSVHLYFLPHILTVLIHLFFFSVVLLLLYFPPTLVSICFMPFHILWQIYTASFLHFYFSLFFSTFSTADNIPIPFSIPPTLWW